MDREDQRQHAELVRDFLNATHWPKHLLVHYRWDVQHEEDEERGLLVLFSGGCGGGRLGGWAGLGCAGLGWGAREARGQGCIHLQPDA